MFCAKFAENGPKVLEKIFFLFHQCIFDIILFSSHWKIPWPLVETNLKSDVCLVFLEKKIKMWKIYKKTDGQVDDDKQAIRKAHLSFQHRWANKKHKVAKNTASILLWQWKHWIFIFLVCLIDWSFTSHSRIFHSIRDLASEGLQIFWPMLDTYWSFF